MKHILVVEDDKAIIEAVSELLESEGHKVTCCLSGQEAIDFIKKAPPADLILLDLMMPDKNGFDFRQEQLILETWRNVPVIIMSADGNIKKKLTQIGGLDYLRKPFDLTEFLEKVKKYCPS